MALYNRNNATATVTGDFSKLPPQPQATIMGDNPHYTAAGKNTRRNLHHNVIHSDAYLRD